MISFLNGFILPALFAASIPILLHFLSKKKAKKIPFSSLKFLKTIENQRIRRVKLYQLLLILVRTLFIIFLVLAFTRPTISDYSIETSNAQTTAFILLDDSYSMQAFANSKTYYEIAKEKLVSLLGVFNKDDNVFLYSQNLSEPIAINLENQEQILKRLKVSNNVLDIKKSLSVADSIFQNHVNLNNELYFLSDFRFQLPQDIREFFEEATNFSAFKIPLIEDIPFKNVSIDTIIIKNQLLEVNKPINISVFLTNHSRTEIETNLNLFSQEDRVGMKFISLGGNQTIKQEINFTPKANGIHNLKLQLNEDDLSIDNNWYFSLDMPQEITILFTTIELSTEINSALNILSGNTIFNIKVSSYTEWLGLNLKNYDLIVLNDLRVLDRNALTLLQSYLNRDGSLILIPGDETSLVNYNSFLKSLIDRNIFSSLQTAEPNSYFSIENQKSENTFFEALFREKENSFSAPKVSKYFKQSDNTNALVRLSNNDSFISKRYRIYSIRKIRYK